MDSMTTPESKNAPETARDFVREAVENDLRLGTHGSRVATRFPPEPNGYLHIGHAKSICLNFGVARQYGGACHLRFDDTNPSKEETEYVEAIQEDIRWLGFDWGEHLYYASDYFEQLYRWAELMIEAGKAYVCDLPAEEVSRTRGTLTRPGTESAFRGRSPAENLDLFRRMRAGEFPDGSRTLRAKIDMSSPYIVLRDPVMYRILRATHHRTGDAWCLYATYDWAHGQSDWIEGITHSICTLEFENNRALYDWFVETLQSLGVKPERAVARPRQYEFARLNLTNTVMSKRFLLSLVESGAMDGWDDPRMPTLCGLRRRGFTPEAIRTFCEKIGVAKTNSTVEMALLEHCVREDLNRRARRAMAVLRPLKIVLTNYPGEQVEEFEAENNPEDPAAGTRRVPFSREIFVEEDDFREDPPKHFFRLAPGREVRLKHAYVIRCEEAVKDGTGRVVELRCTYDPATRGGNTPDGRKVKSTLHWVSARHAVEADVRLFSPLFTKENPYDVPEGVDFRANINPDSLVTLSGCRLEPSLAAAVPGDLFQFLRQGYFCVDSRLSSPGKPAFNRTVTLKDELARIEKRGA